jgi:hypothetical protein
VGDIYQMPETPESRYRRSPGLLKTRSPERPRREFHSDLWVGIALMVTVILLVIAYLVATRSPPPA